MTVLIPLGAAIDRTVSGAKAANLARLMDLGFPVPAGVVVPASAFTATAAEGAPDALPPSQLEELYELVESIVPVAVRSSGIAEDLDGASFAACRARSVAAHASLVAREYGLPAVVAAEGATARLRDGMIVTVDGSAGTVELAA